MPQQAPSTPGSNAARPLFSRVFGLLLLSHLGFSFGNSVFFLLPKYMAQAGAAPFSIGTVMAASGLCGTLAIPWLGPLLDRRRLIDIFLAGHVLMIVGTLGFVPIDPVGPMGALLRGMQGLAWAVEVNAGMAIMANAVPAERIGQAMGIFGATNIFVSALAPALMEPVAAAFHPRVTFVIAGATSIIGWALATRLPQNSRQTTPASRTPLRVIASTPPVTRLLIVVFVTGLAGAAAFTFIGPYVVERNLGAVSPFFVAFTAGALGIRLTTGGLVDRIGPRKIALLCALLYGVVTAAFALLRPGWLVPLAVALGVLQGLFFPSAMALAVALGGPENRGKLLVLGNGAFSAGYTFVIPIGLLVAPLGYSGLFLFIGLLTTATALLLRPTHP